MQKNAFKTNINGSIAVNFALLSSLLLLSIGIAIDYSSIVRERTNVQAYADAAVLAASISGKTNALELQEIAKASVRAQTRTSPDVKLSLIGGVENTVRVSIKSNFPPFILNIFGYDSFNVSAVAEAPLSSGRKLNLAMALDTTLSMQGARITALKTASESLLNAIENASPNPDDVKVSVIPFADYVRIDPVNRNQSWVIIQDDVDRTVQSLDRDKSTNCQDIIENERRRTECDIEVFETRTDTLTWNGCMSSREDDYHKIVGYRGRQFPGPVQAVNCAQHFNIMQPLSSDINNARTTINNLKTGGRTYMPAGLMWAWRTLDRDLPFTEVLSTSREATRDVLLLMTDGSNTTSLNGTISGFEGILHIGERNDDQQSTENANALTKELCSSIKLQDIEIITVAFEVTDTNTLNLLKRCASSRNNFYNATNSASLNRAFQNIGTSLGVIRLSR